MNRLERRAGFRIQESLPFKIGHQGYDIEAETVNISVNGAMCRVERDIPAMTQLSVGLKLSSAKTISAKGVVVRSQKDPRSTDYLIAIYFNDIRSKDQNFLQDYIASRMKGQ